MNVWRLVNPELSGAPVLYGHHIHWLCAVAVALAIMAAWVMLPVIRRYHGATVGNRRAWLGAGALAMGTGIWAMHFTGMLAYRLPFPIRYDLAITALSVVPAVLASGACILLAAPPARSWQRLNLSAIVLAAGIGAMHYAGMEAIVAPTRMYYVPAEFFLSLVAAWGLALIGLTVQSELSSRSDWSSAATNALGSVILGAAVSSMHFIAMQATWFEAGQGLPASGEVAPPWGLVIGIVVTVVTLLGTMLAGTLVDRRFSFMARSLEQSELRFERLAETTRMAIFTFDGERLGYANPALAEMLGRPGESLGGARLGEIFSTEFLDFATGILAADGAGGEAHYAQLEIPRADGSCCWLYFSVSATDFAGRREGLASAVDISEQKATEIRMRDLAYSDPLTGLANRAMFMDRVDRHLQQLRRQERARASYVLLLDLDGFKSVNDSYGHQQGDRLLMQVAARLLHLTRAGDTIARLGGDEFILLLDDLGDETDIGSIAERILEKLGEPVEIADHAIAVQASIGALALDGSSYRSADEVLHDVDVALYRSKEIAGSSWTLFDQALDARVKRSRLLQVELKDAIAERRLQLLYQPIVDAASRRVVGFEALARWQRSNGEWVSPAEFIPLAERGGLVADIGLLALDLAARQLAAWRDGGAGEDVYVSVNVASVSFADERFFERIATIFGDYGFRPGSLKLELTESMLLKDIGDTLGRLEQLIALGCELMIDDFGTGYSSLSYLPRLPIRTLKIDRSFVAGLDESASTVTVVRSIIALAHSLGMDVISEGVETDGQAARLAELGSGALQGYLFAAPLAAEAAERLLRAGQPPAQVAR